MYFVRGSGCAFLQSFDPVADALNLHHALSMLKEVKDCDLVGLCPNADDDAVSEEAGSGHAHVISLPDLQFQRPCDVGIFNAAVAEAISSRRVVQSAIFHGSLLVVWWSSLACVLPRGTISPLFEIKYLEVEFYIAS